MPAVAFELAPAADDLRTVALGVRDDQLDRATPCSDWTVQDLLAHTLGFVRAFRHTARHEDPGWAAAAPGLPDDWRDRLPSELDALTAAWLDESAWVGEAQAGGVTMPSAQLAVAALDELVLHAWDLARATGQQVAPRPEDVEVIAGMVGVVASLGDNRPVGLFGAAVDVPADAGPFDRVLALSGRTPTWVSPAQQAP